MPDDLRGRPRRERRGQQELRRLQPLDSKAVLAWIASSQRPRPASKRIKEAVEKSALKDQAPTLRLHP